MPCTAPKAQHMTLMENKTKTRKRRVLAGDTAIVAQELRHHPPAKALSTGSLV